MNRAARFLVPWCLAAFVSCSKGDDSPTRDLVISEIMYHPVMDPEDDHEFIEVENASDHALDLGGYQLAGGIRFAFAAGTMVQAGQAIVVARRRARLLEVARYQLDGDRVVGDYAGALDNDGEIIRLEKVVSATATTLVDEVAYRDAFPWPLAADELGAGAAWLPAADLPLAKHEFMGRSLERRSFRESGTTPSNWSVSPLDGATPGRASEERTANPALGLAPTVMSIETEVAEKTGSVLTPDRPITVRVRITPDTAPEPAVEYFVDELNRSNEIATRIPLQPVAGGLREARLPATMAGTLLRYRVVSGGGSDVAALSPRPEDPRAFLPLFVSHPIPGDTPSYQLLIAKADWERLFDNIVDGRVPENVSGGNPLQCEVNPRWDDRVPAVLVMGGEVFDIQARYQGSRTNRTGGPRPFDPLKWPASPEFPTVPREPLSWHFNFPRYARPEGKRSFNLNKLTDAACQGFLTRAGNLLFESVGVPAARSSYARLYINGRYYHYMQRLEHLDEEFLKRAFGPDHEVGDLFKSNGTRWDEGPWGFGDEGLLNAHCGYSVDERYAATYERQTLEDVRPGSREVRAMLEGLAAARAAGVPALRKFFADTFDLDRLTDYLVVRNWLGAWDDIWQNHYLYRGADGRWMVMPTDLDNHFGFALPSAVDASFFAGMENGRSNFRDLSNVLKDSFLRAYRAEFIARVRALSQTVLHPSNVQAIIDEAAEPYRVEEAKAAPAGISTSGACSGGDPAAVVARMKAFARGRHERVEDGLFD